jgi:hypothetical protein
MTKTIHAHLGIEDIIMSKCALYANALMDIETKQNKETLHAS